MGSECKHDMASSFRMVECEREIRNMFWLYFFGFHLLRVLIANLGSRMEGNYPVEI